MQESPWLLTAQSVAFPANVCIVEVPQEDETMMLPVPGVRSFCQQAPHDQVASSKQLQSFLCWLSP